MNTIFNIEEKKYTAEDYEKLPESNIRVELIDGTLIMTPHATFWHQNIDARLIYKFISILPYKSAIISEINLYVSDDKYFVPDLVIGYKEKFKSYSRIIPEFIQLVIEIESKSSKGIDRFIKYDSYEESKIPTYVRIVTDDIHNPEIYVYELNKNGKYKEYSHAVSGEHIHIRVLDKDMISVELEFDPKELVE